MELRVSVRRAWRLTVYVGVFGIVFGAYGQMLDLPLDGQLRAKASGKTVAARLGPGAKFVPSVEGKGVEPGARGPAVIVPVPKELWRSSGTLAFRFRTSRTVNVLAAKKMPAISLVDCPVFTVVMQETKRCPRLLVRRRSASKARPGRLDLSHLDGGKWYHIAFSWDAKNGKLEAYLNGVLQARMFLYPKGPFRWDLPSDLSGDLRLGGTLGTGADAVRVAVDSVQLWPSFMNEAQIRQTLRGRAVAPLRGEGRTDYKGRLDLSPYKLRLVYQADFTKPLNVVMEDDLFDGEKRVRRPEGYEWVFEGPGKAWTEGGRLHMESFKPKAGGHIVLWNTRVFPADVLLEFGFAPENSQVGLTIIFFCATTREGGDIFGLGVPRRGGVFRNYHSGVLNNYHVSYWAVSSGGVGRRTANLRKNYGFFLPACGIDRIEGKGAGPHRVRLLKVGNKIRLETCGRLSLLFDDDGHTYGPVWGAGRIGLRQMGHTHRASYTYYRVWQVSRK